MGWYDRLRPSLSQLHVAGATDERAIAVKGLWSRHDDVGSGYGSGGRGERILVAGAELSLSSPRAVTRFPRLVLASRM
jgi:hypothetical protein